MKKFIITESQLDKILLTESKTSQEYKDIGIKLLLSHIKKKYPYIINISYTYGDHKIYGTLLPINIEFDLLKFYEVTNEKPRYNSIEILTDTHRFMESYTTGDDYRGFVFVDKLEEDLKNYYKTLPPHMRYSKFEGFTDDELSIIGLRSGIFFSPKEIKDWQNEKEPIRLSISNFIPVITDMDKLKEMFFN